MELGKLRGLLDDKNSDLLNLIKSPYETRFSNLLQFIKELNELLQKYGNCSGSYKLYGFAFLSFINLWNKYKDKMTQKEALEKIREKAHLIHEELGKLIMDVVSIEPLKLISVVPLELDLSIENQYLLSQLSPLLCLLSKDFLDCEKNVKIAVFEIYSKLKPEYQDSNTLSKLIEMESGEQGILEMNKKWFEIISEDPKERCICDEGKHVNMQCEDLYELIIKNPIWQREGINSDEIYEAFCDYANLERKESEQSSFYIFSLKQALYLSIKHSTEVDRNRAKENIERIKNFSLSEIGKIDECFLFSEPQKPHSESSQNFEESQQQKKQGEPGVKENLSSEDFLKWLNNLFHPHYEESQIVKSLIFLKFIEEKTVDDFLNQLKQNNKEAARRLVDEKYKRCALISHPDKTKGTHEKFIELSQCKDCLCKFIEKYNPNTDERKLCIIRNLLFHKKEDSKRELHEKLTGRQHDHKTPTTLPKKSFKDNYCVEGEIQPGETRPQVAEERLSSPARDGEIKKDNQDNRAEEIINKLKELWKKYITGHFGVYIEDENNSKVKGFSADGEKAEKISMPDKVREGKELYRLLIEEPSDKRTSKDILEDFKKRFNGDMKNGNSGAKERLKPHRHSKWLRVWYNIIRTLAGLRCIGRNGISFWDVSCGEKLCKETEQVLSKVPERKICTK